VNLEFDLRISRSQFSILNSNRVGGCLAALFPPHHRAYGSEPRRFLTSLNSQQPQCLTSFKHPALPRDFRPPLPASGPPLRHLLRTDRKSALFSMSGSALHWAVKPATMTSANFCLPIPPPLDGSTTRQVDRPPRVRRATFIPHTRRIYFHIFQMTIGLRVSLPPSPNVAASYVPLWRDRACQGLTPSSGCALPGAQKIAGPSGAGYYAVKVARYGRIAGPAANCTEPSSAPLSRSSMESYRLWIT